MINEAFVLAYMLNNSEPRLKVEIMNLVKDKAALPLYIRNFENISKLESQNY
jgi:hypothetical protein